MAGRDIEPGYQLYQILQRRHLFEKPIELLVKVRCQDGRLREIWVPKSEVVATEVGRKMWREFSKTKVGERGVDVYIGKRRSFSNANRQCTEDGKVPLVANNGLRNEAGENPSGKASIKKLTINVSRVRSIISSESSRKIKSRTYTNTKQNINNSSKFSSNMQARNFARPSSRHNSRTSNCRSKISILNNKQSSDLLLPRQATSHSKSLDGSKKSESSNGNPQVPLKRTLSLTDSQKPEDCKMPRLEHFNCRNPQTQCPANQVCPSCVSFFPTKGEDAHHGFQASLVLGYQAPLPTFCTKCCHHHSGEDTKTGKISHPSVVMEAVAMERRVSIRQTESAFRLKEILVRKFAGFVHLILGSETSNKKIFKNSFNPKVLHEICTVLRNLAHDDCRVVLISGSGSIFSSGIDITYLLDSELDRKTAAKNMVEALRDFINSLISFPKPIVVAVNGPSTGLGTAMLPLCDIVYASDKASFSCPYTSFAQTSEACSSYTFPKVMGHAMANEMLLRGRKITALEAHQIGLVTQVFWPENLMGEVIPRVQNLVQHPSKAVECTKALIRNHKKAKLEMINESECRMLNDRWQSSECQKAMRIFIDEQTNSL